MVVVVVVVVVVMMMTPNCTGLVRGLRRVGNAGHGL
jgi:hypothetical protein